MARHYKDIRTSAKQIFIHYIDMKKILTLALCATTMFGAMAQKQVVDQAAKMSGKFDKLNEARGLIKGAMGNAETANDVRTYFVAGELEFDAFDNGVKAGMINPQDPSADPETMADELLSGYGYFMKALPLDSIPDAKGKVNPKFSKKIVGKIGGHVGDFFNAGGTKYNNKKYNDAYDLFMIYANLPEATWMGKSAPALTPEQRSLAYYYAGLAAYFSQQPEKATMALKKAREAGYEDPEAQNYVLEIASWQQIAQDSTKADLAKDNIIDVARAGYNKYGVTIPLFISNLVNAMINDGKYNEAFELMDAEIAKNPDNAWLYGLRGYVYDVNGNEEKSEADYRKAASLPGVDFETLKNAAKKIYRIGAEKLNTIEGNSAEAQAARKDLKTNYFEVAKQIVDHARQMPNADGSIDYVSDAINYALETYFNN